MEQLLYPIDEGAARLGISVRTFYDLIKNNEVRTVLIGRRRLVSPEALREYVTTLESHSA